MSYRAFASITAVLALACSLLAMGCDKNPSSSAATQPAPPKGEGVGLVDMDQVATDLGWFRSMQTNLEVVEKQLKADLQARADQLSDVRAEYQRLGLKVGDKLSPQQEQYINQAILTRRQVYAQFQQGAPQLYQQYKAEWLKRYREALEPVVKDVGFAKKTKLVVSKTDTILYFDNTIDLTAAVTAAAREKPPVFSPPPKPVLPPVPDLSGAGSATQPAIGGGGVGGGGGGAAPATLPAAAPASKK